MRVLLLAAEFPPVGTPGALRVGSWHEHFPALGVEPIVVTAVPEEAGAASPPSATGSVHRVPLVSNPKSRLVSAVGVRRLVVLRRLLSFWYANSRLLTLHGDETRGMLETAREVVRSRRPDVIVATGGPFVTFRYASLVASEARVPWVADYRDGWSLNYARYEVSWLERSHMRWFHRPIERRIVGTANLITTVSGPLRDELRVLFPDRRVEVVSNGFAKGIVARVTNTSQRTDGLSICYLGSVYSYQRLDIFLDGLRRFLGRNPGCRCRVEFVGTTGDGLSRILKLTRGLDEHVSIVPPLPHEEALRRAKAAHLLLLLANERVDGSCSKVFEYLALNRRILLCVDDHGSLGDVVRTTRAGVIAETAAHVAGFLREAYQEYRQTGRVSQGQGDFDRFSRENQARRLVRLIREIVS